MKERQTPTEVAAMYTVTPETVREWLTKGVGLPDGTRVRLKAERVAARWWIDAADLAAFRTRCTNGSLPRNSDTETAGYPVPSKSDAKHRAATQARLKELGI